MTTRYVPGTNMADQLVDIQALGAQLKVPVKTIRNKLCNGTWPLPPVRIGRALRWRQADIDRLKCGEIGGSPTNATR